jgi:RNA polymerase-binding transcription factor DksA
MEDKRNQKGALPKASTADVLGVSFGVWKVDPRWEEEHRALSELRSSIVSRRKRLVAQAALDMGTPAQSLEDAGADDHDRDFALGMASSDQEVLYEIEHALNRIREGTYGVCELTGRKIEPERLKAIPWARFSAEAEMSLETEGQLRRARLGAFATIPKEPIPAEEEVLEES